MFTFPWTPFDYSSCCCISPTIPNFSFNTYDKMQCQASYLETLRYSAQAKQTNLYPAISRMENEKIADQLHHVMTGALCCSTLYSDNVPIEITTEKKKTETIFDLDRLMFPDDPIRDWVEKKTHEILGVSEMKHLDIQKKEEKQDMTIPVKPGDIVQLKPFYEVCDANREAVYGISESVYNDLCKGPITVRKVTPTKGTDSIYNYTFEVLSNAGNRYVVPCIAIDKIFSVVDDTNTGSDSVNHPSHYNQNGMEVWDVIKAFTSNLSGAEAFYAGNVIKYVLRWDHKNGIEDLEKAKVYIDKIIEMEKKK